jgi:flagellar export protein FliJ
VKRFKFRLQTVYDYKLTVESEQKTALLNARTELRALEAELERVEAEMLREPERLTVGELSQYSNYREFLREYRKTLFPKIAEAEKKVEACQQALIITMNELKAYDKLREKHYEQWKTEEAAAERLVLDDFMAADLVN